MTVAPQLGDQVAADESARTGDDDQTAAIEDVRAHRIVCFRGPIRR